MFWARTENGSVVETTDFDPSERFHSDLLWQICSSDVRPGWIIIDGDFSPPPVQTSTEQAEVERVWRNFELGATEWLVTRHRDEQDLGVAPTLTVKQFPELLSYRQALRDWPQAATFPRPEFRPIAPPWIADQTQ
ncbi:phage tail assembly chaperone [Pseudomonas beijingensis]|uniref:phage tail assembly chaperone n=1 Tax=Pseudomonas beijingensis TaxID=2954101 RepID=UPI002733F1ED|nr:phage tail assembly chaperone [Pseudomonas sp. FP2262]WLH47465.1 phage tail assembly chaperone [Pseudomonas sp. FP2262]